MKKLVLALTILTQLCGTIQAGPSCMGYTQNNPETGVGTGGNLRFIGCGCECRKFERTSDDRCLNCLHHQAGTAIGFVVDITDHTDPIVGQDPSPSPEPSEGIIFRENDTEPCA